MFAPKEHYNMVLKYWESIWAIFWAILRPCFGYFNYISVSIYLKWLKVSLNSCADHDKNTMKYSAIRTIWGPYQLYLHARVIFELC